MLRSDTIAVDDRLLTIVCTVADLGDIVRAKFDFDVVGHYARPDVLSLRVNEKPNSTVTFLTP